MKTTIKVFLSAFLLTLLMNSCFNRVFEYGNGIINEEIRVIPAFNSITSAGAFDIYFEYADTPSVIVSCESNLIEYVETAVFENELKIRTPNFVNIKPRKTIEIYVKGPEIEKIYLSGSGLIHADSVSSDNLTLGLSGSGKIETTFYGENLYTKVSGSGKINIYAECILFDIVISGSGKVDMLGYADICNYNISGSGEVHAFDFPVYEADVRVSGSGNLYLNVEEKLSANISGSGNIHYIGSPQIISNISGSGKLINNN
jgi:hypothetical protein